MSRFLDLPRLYALRGVARVARLAGGPPEEARDAIEAAIAGADAEILAHLGSRYPTELPTTPASTPAILQEYAASIALWNLVKAHDSVAPTLRQAYEDARAFLRDAAAGRVDLGLATRPAADSTTPGVLVLKPAGAAKLSLSGLEDW